MYTPEMRNGTQPAKESTLWLHYAVAGLGVVGVVGLAYYIKQLHDFFQELPGEESAVFSRDVASELNFYLLTHNKQ